MDRSSPIICFSPVIFLNSLYKSSSMGIFSGRGSSANRKYTFLHASSITATSFFPRCALFPRISSHMDTIKLHLAAMGSKSLSSSLQASRLISIGLICTGEFKDIVMFCPLSSFTKKPYSPSGSMII